MNSQNFTECKSHYCCCDIKEEVVSICQECGNAGKSVMEITLKSIAKENVIKNIDSLNGFIIVKRLPTKLSISIMNEGFIFIKMM